MRAEGRALLAGARRRRTDARSGNGCVECGFGGRTVMLPGAPFIARRGKDLFIEDCAARALAARFGTPLYVYSRSAMLAALAPWPDALTGCVTP